jgi:autotransporter-associated beta strand protein
MISHLTKGTVCLSIALSASLSMAASRTNIVKNLTSDWTNSANFQDSTWLPGSGDDDTVIIPRDAVVTLSDGDSASVAQFKKLKRVIFASESSELDIVVNGSDPLEIPVPITQYQYVMSSRDMKCGPLVKKGPGTLHLSSTVLGNSTMCFDYYSEIRVDAGVLKLQQNTAKTQYYLGRITVEAGATVYLPSASATYSVVLQGLNGAGDVMRDSSVNCSLVFQNSKNINPADFSGCLSGAYLEVSCTGDGQVFSGSSSMTVGAQAFLKPSGTYAELGVTGLQGQNANSSIGYNVVEFWFRGADSARSCLNYIGSGGAVLTSFCSDSGATGIFAANGTGAVDVQKPIQRYWHSKLGTRFVLAGDSALTNSYTADITDNFVSGDASASGHGVYLSKEGSTTWLMSDRARTFASGISVDEGVLQYKTMAPAGKTSSLGTATFLTDGTTGKGDSNAEHRVEYAIRLGGPKSDGTRSDSGRLEYVGTADFLVTNRLVAVAGAGGLRNNGTAKTCFSGVSGISSGDMTLYLDGSGTRTNELNKVSDGTAGGSLSVVKEGAGTWMLTGEQSWSGNLDVRGGRLVVSNPQYYRWYKWCITALVPGTVDPDVGKKYQFGTRLGEFALCAADKKEVTRGYPVTQRTDAAIGPGTAALVYDGPYTVNIAEGAFGRLFDGLAYHSGHIDIYYSDGSATYRPEQSDPSTWQTFVMRLPSDAPAIVGYDYANFRGSSNGDSYTSVSNYFVEASLDGCTWTRLKTFEGNASPWTQAGCQWKYSSGDVETVNTGYHPNTNWDAIDSAPSAYPNVLGNVGTVSVSGGATLELEPGSRPVALNSLKIDAGAVAGSISGFSFAQSGTLYVTNFDSRDHEVELPVDLSLAESAGNVAQWTLYVNGVDVSGGGWHIRSANGRLTLSRPGLFIIIR